MSKDPTSVAPDTTPLPKFNLDYAATSRSKCKACLNPIDKDVLRLGISTPFRGKFAYFWRHWGCIKNEELGEIQQVGNLSDVSGYSELLEEDQIRLSKAVESGHISEEDVEEQRNKNKEAGTTESRTGKLEDEKRERRKSKKRKEIEEAEDSDNERKKKKKVKEQEASAAEPLVTPKSGKVTPNETNVSLEVIPDSEDDSVAVSPKKAKPSPKKGKSKAPKTNPVKGDISIDVDMKDGHEEAPAPANNDAKSKPKEKKTAVAADDKKTTKQATKPEKKTKEADSEIVSATKTKAKPKPTAKKATAKKAVSGASTSDDKSTTPKPKDDDTKADKTMKPLPPTGILNSGASDHGATSPSPIPSANPPAPVYLDLNGIAELLRGSSSSSLFQAPTTSRSHPPPRIPLTKFCKKYKLSSSLEAKLEKLEIGGPHVLRLIKDSALQAEGGLSIGELAGLRDAEERWMADCH